MHKTMTGRSVQPGPVIESFPLSKGLHPVNSGIIVYNNSLKVKARCKNCQSRMQKRGAAFDSTPQIHFSVIFQVLV